LYIFYIQDAPNCSKVSGAVKRSLDVYGCEVCERVCPTNKDVITNVSDGEFRKCILRRRYRGIANEQDKENSDDPHKLKTKMWQNFELQI
jgi:ferredoxin